MVLQLISAGNEHTLKTVVATFFNDNATVSVEINSYYRCYCRRCPARSVKAIVFYSTESDQIHNWASLHDTYPIMSMPCLLMPWYHQQAWYWTNKPEHSISWWRHQMKTFPRFWPFVRGIHWSQVNSPHKGQWRGALISRENHHASVVWNWYHWVAIAYLYQPTPTDSADVKSRLQRSDTSSIPPINVVFFLCRE